MKSAEQRWSAEHSRQFSDHYETMRGHVRQEVVRDNLNTQLVDFLKFPRRIIDVGGGEGGDARWLAAQHHEVVLVDSDESALAQAHQYNYPILEDLIVGTTETALARYGSGTFDMVVSHGTVLYANSPQYEINQLAHLVREGGYISLLTAGKLAKLKRFEETGQSAAYIRLNSTGRYVNNLGLEATAHLPQEVQAMLQNAGFDVAAWFGVRVHSDKDERLIEEVPALHRNRALQSELRASRDPSLRPGGQMLHFIARKKA